MMKLSSYIARVYNMIELSVMLPQRRILPNVRATLSVTKRTSYGNMFVAVCSHLTSFQIRHWPLELNVDLRPSRTGYVES